MTERLTRFSLWLAFVFNLLAAAVFATPASALGQWMGLPASVHPIYSVMVAFFVALFGCVYAWLARRPSIDRPLLGLGCIGKTGAFVIAAGLWLSGDVSGVVLLVALGDLAFAAVWFAWLRSSAAAGRAR
jgi:hypothetical protein